MNVIRCIAKNERSHKVKFGPHEVQLHESAMSAEYFKNVLSGSYSDSEIEIRLENVWVDGDPESKKWVELLIAYLYGINTTIESANWVDAANVLSILKFIGDANHHVLLEKIVDHANTKRYVYEPSIRYTYERKHGHTVLRVDHNLRAFGKTVTLTVDNIEKHINNAITYAWHAGFSKYGVIDGNTPAVAAFLSDLACEHRTLFWSVAEATRDNINQWPEDLMYIACDKLRATAINPTITIESIFN